MNDPERAVVIASFFELFEADLVRMRLEEEGIEVIMDGEALMSLQPVLGQVGTGGTRLRVAEADVEAAQEVLQRYREEKAAAEEERGRVCPWCQSTDCERIHRSWLFGIAAVMTLGVFCLLVRWSRFRCRTCGGRWR